MVSRADAPSAAPARTQALAHRGASAHAPENTTAAFDLAIEMGADGIETDLRLTRDEAVVLFHDPTVDRSTDGRGEVAALTLREILALDAGRWFHPRFAGLRVPDLRSFLRCYAGRTALELELKVAEAAPPALEIVRRGRFGASVTFTSFQYSLLEVVRRRAPWARVGWLVERITPEALEAVLALDGVQICPWAVGLTGEQVAMAHRQGLRVRAWGVPDRWHARQMVALGADGVTVDRLDWLGQAVRRDTPCPAGGSSDETKA